MDRTRRMVSNVIFAQQQKICLFIIITHGEAENQGNRMHQIRSFLTLSNNRRGNICFLGLYSLFEIKQKILQTNPMTR